MTESLIATLTEGAVLVWARRSEGKMACARDVMQDNPGDGVSFSCSTRVAPPRAMCTG